MILNHQQFQHGWTTSTMPLEDTSRLNYRPAPAGECTEPAFYRGSFQMDEALDTYLLVSCGTRGIVWINGQLLERYHRLGPVNTLFVPKTMLRQGENTLEVFEAEHMYKPMVRLLDHPVIGGVIRDEQ